MKTIWLASYPKSGNTWFRMLVANLDAKDDDVLDINALSERGGIASARGPLDHLLLVESGLLTHDECDSLRPLVYEELARGEDDDEYDEKPATPPIRFVKVHDAYTVTRSGEPLLAGLRGAAGAIVIVRDPRDVAPSYANHSNISIDKAIDAMNDEELAYCAKPGRQHPQLRQHLLGWSGHIASWLKQRDIPVHLVRYEDLLRETTRVFAEALAFAGRAASADDVERAVRRASFEELKAQENAKGFRETLRPWEKNIFFRRGEAGAWRDELTADQIARIESKHAAMMRRLGYDLFSPEKEEAA